MELVLLEEQQRRFFDDNGYLVVPGALMEQEVVQLTTVCDRMINEFGREADQYYVQRRPGIVQEKAFHPLLTHSSTVPLVVQLLSPNIHLHTTAIIYKFPQDDSGEGTRGWHRDIGMTEDLGHEGIVRAGIKVGYCLTDFPAPQSGFTMFAPGSHLLPTPLPIPRGQGDPEGAVDLCLNAGDAFLFENRVFHTAAPNVSQRTSKVVILGYSYRWMGGLRDNMNLVQPGDEVLDQVDDIGKQLLGGSSNGLAEWAREQGIAPEPIEWTKQV
ncbi:MAG: phytanoyl-CoA dioxygenase family protein [Gemmatimonadetes bacterium]|nr:phytanoyl-CoA dioxygenase family protein [Gemmatimonadota bacterium]